MKRKSAGIILFNGDDKVLIEHPTNHDPNFWSFPKGLVDEGETYFETALRECLEETSLDLSKLVYKIVKELPEITFRNKRKVLKLFVLKITETLYDFPFKCESMVTKNRDGSLREHIFPEVDDFKWVSLEEAYPLLHESQQRAVDVLKLENEQI